MMIMLTLTDVALRHTRNYSYTTLCTMRKGFCGEKGFCVCRGFVGTREGGARGRRVICIPLPTGPGCPLGPTKHVANWSHRHQTHANDDFKQKPMICHVCS